MLFLHLILHTNIALYSVQNYIELMKQSLQEFELFIDKKHRKRVLELTNCTKGLHI